MGAATGITLGLRPHEISVAALLCGISFILPTITGYCYNIPYIRTDLPGMLRVKIAVQRGLLQWALLPNLETYYNYRPSDNFYIMGFTVCTSPHL